MSCLPTPDPTANKMLERSCVRPSDTNNTLLYHVGSTGSDTRKQLEMGGRGFGLVEVVNTTGTAATCRVFLDRFGDTYDETTALGGYDRSIPAGSNRLIVVPALCDDQPATHLAVRTGTADALTFRYMAESQ